MQNKLDRNVISKLLADDSTYAFILLVIILSHVGDMDLADIEDTEVLFKDLEEEFNCKIPEENENKINAVITALTTDLFWRNFSVTKSISLAFKDGDIGDMALYGDEEIEVCYILWAALEVGMIHNMTLLESLNDFSPSIAEQINNLLDNEAEDREDEEVNEIDEIMREPYYHRYISYNLLNLTAQLIDLGVDTTTVKDMWLAYTSCIDDLSQPEDN